MKTRSCPAVNITIAALAVFMCVALASPVAVTALKTGRAVPVYRTGDFGRLALVITVEWDASPLPDLLDALSRLGVQATFALGREFVEAEPELTRRIAAEGHGIAALWEGGAEETVSIIESVTGSAPTAVFAEREDAPAAARACAKSGLYTVCATVGLRSGEGTAADIAKRAESAAAGGVIFAAQPTRGLAEALPLIAEKIKNMGLDIVPVHKMLYNNNGSI